MSAEARSKKSKPNLANESHAIAIQSEVQITAGAGEGDKKGPPSFVVDAYTGGPVKVPKYELPIVIDLSGLDRTNSLVANLDHNASQRVGHVTSLENDGKTLRLSGLASASTPARREVVDSAADGFVWQASVEATPLVRPELITMGQSTTVNGQTFEGPVFIARKTKLRGFAFVSHGADDDTTVAIAASASLTQEKTTMLDEKIRAWAESLGVDVENATDEQLEQIEASYEGQNSPKKKPQKLDDIFEQHKADEERRAEITAIAAESMTQHPDQISEIRVLADTAIEAKWDVDKFELESLRRSRVQARPNFGSRGQRDQLNSKVITAAVCRMGGLHGLDKHFDEKTLDVVDARFKDGLGLQELLMVVARANGCGSISCRSDLRGVLQAAFPQVQANAFSTISLPNILTAAANKFLVDGWNAVDDTWSRISTRKSVSNFQTHTSYSLTGGFNYEQVGPSGELHHGTVGETSYTNKADTYGKMFAITRTDIINDDLGALTAMPKRLGRGAALKLNNVFWTAFLNNSSHFTSGNSNVSTGAGSALDTDGGAITGADIVFMNQTDPDSEPLGITPKILLVPTTLKSTALQLIASENVKGSTDGGDRNIWRDRFQVESSPYMENSSYTGNSTAAWYILADPNDLSTIEVAFLNGREQPIVETADADFNVLGVQMRGYHDFGVSLQEVRAGVRAAGA